MPIDTKAFCWWPCVHPHIGIYSLPNTSFEGTPKTAFSLELCFFLTQIFGYFCYSRNIPMKTDSKDISANILLTPLRQGRGRDHKQETQCQASTELPTVSAHPSCLPGGPPDPHPPLSGVPFSFLPGNVTASVTLVGSHRLWYPFCSGVSLL